MTKFITNQNIEIKLELASLGDRIIAFLIDALIITTYYFLIGFLSSEFIQEDIISYIFLIPTLFYSLLFEVFFNGQSPGKKVREIRVVKLDGGAPTFINYLLRWILRPIDILLYGSVAMLSIIATKNAQRLGDLAAGTTVIKLRSSVELDDVTTVKREDHKITFPQVKRLNDKQVELIRKSLQMRRDGYADSVNELANKVKESLKIESDMPDVKFLYTVLADYESSIH